MFNFRNQVANSFRIKLYNTYKRTELGGPEDRRLSSYTILFLCDIEIPCVDVLRHCSGGDSGCVGPETPPRV